MQQQLKQGQRRRQQEEEEERRQQQEEARRRHKQAGGREEALVAQQEKERQRLAAKQEQQQLQKRRQKQQEGGPGLAGVPVAQEPPSSEAQLAVSSLGGSGEGSRAGGAAQAAAAGRDRHANKPRAAAHKALEVGDAGGMPKLQQAPQHAASQASSRPASAEAAGGASAQAHDRQGLPASPRPAASPRHAAAGPPALQGRQQQEQEQQAAPAAARQGSLDLEAELAAAERLQLTADGEVDLAALALEDVLPVRTPPLTAAPTAASAAAAAAAGARGSKGSPPAVRQPGSTGSKSEQATGRDAPGLPARFVSWTGLWVCECGQRYELKDRCPCGAPDPCR